MDNLKINLQCAVNRNDSNGDSLHTFRLVANTGGAMSFGDVPVYLDVNGVKLHTANIPIAYGHDLTQGIGHATSVAVDNGDLIVEGVVSRDTDCAKEFVKSSLNGFPWQASVGCRVLETLEIRDDQTYNLNGETIKAPADVILKSELYEVSVVELGADKNTSAVITASDKELHKMSEEIKTEKSDVVKASLEELRNSQADEFQRISEIKAKAQPNDDMLVAQAIREGWTADKFELESLRANRAQAPAIHCKSSDSVDSKALEIYALRASGVPLNEKRYTDQQLTASDSLKNLSLQEFCELACGQQLPKFKNDEIGWLRAAFSTNSLSYVLSRSFNAILLDSFNFVENEWRKVFKIGRVTDFKTADRYRMNGSFTFEKVANGGKLANGSASDERFAIKADTYGKMYSITRQDLINDDLGAFTQIPAQIGVGCGEKINQVCWSTFMAPGNLADSKDYYHADHGNLLTSKALTLDNLSAARAAFVKGKKSKTIGGDQLIGIRPSLLIVPVELEDKALMLTKATLLNNGASADNPADYNPQIGRFNVVASAYLSDAAYTNYSASTWYLAANPVQLAGFEISFLNGKDAPTIERADADFDTLGIQFRGYIDFGVSVQDPKGVMRITA